MLKSELSVQDLTIAAPNLSNPVKLNGVELKENITFMVLVPKNINVLKNTDAKIKTVARLNP